MSTVFEVLFYGFCLGFGYLTGYYGVQLWDSCFTYKLPSKKKDKLRCRAVHHLFTKNKS